MFLNHEDTRSCNKLTWNVPRATRTYLVQKVLAAGLSSARVDILARYANFFRSLRVSPCQEVSVMASIAGRDVRTTTGRNLKLLEELTGLNPWIFGSARKMSGGWPTWPLSWPRDSSWTTWVKKNWPKKSLAWLTVSVSTDTILLLVLMCMCHVEIHTQISTISILHREDCSEVLEYSVLFLKLSTCT